jgi:hypothetical protein
MPIFVELSGNVVRKAWSAVTGRGTAFEVVTVNNHNPDQLMFEGIPTARAVAQSMLVEGALRPRPKSPMPQVSGNVVRFSDLPAETLIVVADLISGDVLYRERVETSQLEMNLPDSGHYRIEVEAPYPALASAVEFYV